jgi:hypothetical protein
MSNKPAAWLAFATDGSESSAVYMLKEQADAAAREWGWDVAPLYAARQATLTDKEREAIEYAAVLGRVAGDLDRDVLRGLLERTK